MTVCEFLGHPYSFAYAFLPASHQYSQTTAGSMEAAQISEASLEGPQSSVGLQ